MRVAHDLIWRTDPKVKWKMAGTTKKNVMILLASLLCSLFLPLWGQSSLLHAATSATSTLVAPYSIHSAFYRLHKDIPQRLPEGGTSAIVLAITVTPEVPDVSLYASGSQVHGLATELGVSVDGLTVSSHAIFPQGVEKTDPLGSGKLTRIFEGPFAVFIPLPESLSPGTFLDIRLTGLACSAVNCTPLLLTQTVSLPDAASQEALPDTASSPWQETLFSGVVEPLAALSGSGATAPVPSRFAPVALEPESSRARFPATPLPGAFLVDITPIPFTPGLEVSSLGKALVLGFLAGLILNLMPCVLPVLGIKLAALLAHGGDSSETISRFRRHQLFFALGILVWFAVLAGLFHFLDMAWGQIFQSPMVVFALAVILLLLALNLFGLFSLPLIDLRAGNTRNPDIRAFVEGFGATLLATPCGGPLLEIGRAHV